MPIISFAKYQGTGNDFILIDNRGNSTPFTTQQIKFLCDRKFGIGADGLMLLQNKAGYDFEMVYFNADGNPSSMCGNGGRCIVAFAHHIGVVSTKHMHFVAVDGPHEAKFSAPNQVELKMSNVSQVESNDGCYWLDTGSPHHIEFTEALNKIDVYKAGHAIRNNATYVKEGVNVNFTQILSEDTIAVATYERGVEDETLSCGTGVTAAAIATTLHTASVASENSVKIQTKGGPLQVSFEHNDKRFENIWLKGSAQFVFEGSIQVADNL
jgi:diaminopimelate epimerase